MISRVGNISLCVVALCAVAAVGIYGWTSIQVVAAQEQALAKPAPVIRVPPAAIGPPKVNQPPAFRNPSLNGGEHLARCAKAIGVAILEYAKDHEGYLPQAASWNTNFYTCPIERYLTNDTGNVLQELDNFVYERDGEATASMTNLRYTELGYIPDPMNQGVRYVAWADGSAQAVAPDFQPPQQSDSSLEP